MPIRLLFLVAALTLTASLASGVTFEWVGVGDPGNLAGPYGFGGVPYIYKISKYEVRNAQYTEFLNAVAATDTNALYNTSMGDDATFGGITRSGVPGSYTYSVKPGFEDKPVVYVSAHDARRFVNWLHNGQPTGAQDSTTTEDGSYGGGAGFVRNAGATIFLPTESEWYKAAYYEPVSTTYFEYPTGTNTPTDCVPPTADTGNSANCSSVIGALTDVGSYTLSPSPNGTSDQGGNVLEWTQDLDVRTTAPRFVRGGSWANYGLAASTRGSIPGTAQTDYLGFRLVKMQPCSNEFDDDDDGFADYPDDPGCTSADDLWEGDTFLICDNGEDEDLDGLADVYYDPGCTGPADPDEHDLMLPCDDGADNDGDGRADYQHPAFSSGGDSGCYDVSSPRENPQCQDGLNNDSQTGIDFDGGALLDIDPQDGFIDAEFNAATPPVGTADPECWAAYVNKERKTQTGHRCGLGFELALVLPLVLRLWQRRRSVSR